MVCTDVISICCVTDQCIEVYFTAMFLSDVILILLVRSVTQEGAKVVQWFAIQDDSNIIYISVILVEAQYAYFILSK